MSLADVGRRRVEYRNWTAAEDAQLAVMWQTRSLNDCAAALGRGTGSVYNRVQKLKLKRTDEYKAITGCGRFGTRKPWNAGLKGWKAGGRSKDTQFKPGQKPSNTWRPIGAERVSKDGILYRKVADTGVKTTDWRAVHVLTWEADNGPLPEGMIVIFKDRNRENMQPDNLTAITRAENMRRNTIHRYPEHVSAACKRLGWYRRKLRKLEEQHEESHRTV